ncbi:UNVERIFIED_CONTAM: hypothetical protein FKN15_045892 [Acipenser sinensis]
MFAEKKPTTRKVLKLLQASLSTKEEDQSLKYLQQHIRGLDDASLRKMLRFMTGSDVICVEQLKIEFSSLEGWQGGLLHTHTCGPLLELPSTYQAYPEFRGEMENLLANKDCFTMGNM